MAVTYGCTFRKVTVSSQLPINAGSMVWLMWIPLSKIRHKCLLVICMKKVCSLRHYLNRIFGAHLEVVPETKPKIQIESLTVYIYLVVIDFLVMVKLFFFLFFFLFFKIYFTSIARARMLCESFSTFRVQPDELGPWPGRGLNPCCSG